MIKQEKKYYDEFIYMKAIAVCLVIFGHSFISGTSGYYSFEYIIKFIYSFHMPIFFFCSGFFALKIYKLSCMNENKDLIIEKFKRLMIPYFTVTIMAIPLKLILNSFVKRPIVMKQLIIDMFIYPNQNPIFALWFVYTLFIIFMIFIMVNKRIKIIIIISLVLPIIAGIYKIEILNLYGVFRNMIFFSLGLVVRSNYVYAKKNIQEKKYIALLAFITLVLLNFNNYTNSIIIELIYCITGILGIICVLFISLKLAKRNKTPKWISSINKYSFDIYLLSWFTQNCIGYSLYKVFEMNYITVIIITFISGFIPILISKYLIRKNSLLSRCILGIYK